MNTIKTYRSCGTYNLEDVIKTAVVMGHYEAHILAFHTAYTDKYYWFTEASRGSLSYLTTKAVTVAASYLPHRTVEVSHQFLKDDEYGEVVMIKLKWSESNEDGDKFYCKVCGQELTEIRGRYLKDSNRLVCGTCEILIATDNIKP